MMNLLKMMRIVLWSFFGVRRRASHEADFAAVNVSLLPVMAVLLAAGFGLTLFCLVKLALTVAH
jgi:nitrate reductase NapE component